MCVCVRCVCLKVRCVYSSFQHEGGLKSPLTKDQCLQHKKQVACYCLSFRLISPCVAVVVYSNRHTFAHEHRPPQHPVLGNGNTLTHTKKKTHTHASTDIDTDRRKVFSRKLRIAHKRRATATGQTGCGTQINIHQPVASGRRCCSCSDSGRRVGTRVFQYHKHNLRERTCDWYGCTTKDTHTHTFIRATDTHNTFTVLSHTTRHRYT